MENSSPKAAKARKKSVGSEKSVAEAAPNINGSKDGGQEIDESTEVKLKVEDVEMKEEEAAQGRKRKADEMVPAESISEAKEVEEKPKIKGRMSKSIASNNNDAVILFSWFRIRNERRRNQRAQFIRRSHLGQRQAG